MSRTQYEKSCWWQEGELCYYKNHMRNMDGRSLNKCYGKCKNYYNKRVALSSIIPNEKLIIKSEQGK